MYIYYIRINFAKKAKYVMGIIWIYCGYHMEHPGSGMVSSWFQLAWGMVNACISEKQWTKRGGQRKQINRTFLLKILCISKKCCTFARFFLSQYKKMSFSK